MATRARRRATTTRRRKPRAAAAAKTNPRRRRSRRRHNPHVVARRRTRRRSVAVNPRRRRRHFSRRGNPSALKVGQILKDMIYGAGGAIVTRTVSSLAQGFVPGAFASNPLVGPGLQALTAVTVVRWAGKKFLGPAQGDIMMLGGLISAGLDAADKFLPNIQGQLTGIIRAPVQVAAPVNVQGVTAEQAALADVYDVGGFADVEDVQLSEFGSY